MPVLASTAISLRKYTIDRTWTIPLLPLYSVFGCGSFCSYCVQLTHIELYSMQGSVRCFGEVIPLGPHNNKCGYCLYSVSNEPGLQVGEVYSSYYMVHLVELELSWFPSGTQHLTTVMNCLTLPFFFSLFTLVVLTWDSCEYGALASGNVSIHICEL